MITEIFWCINCKIIFNELINDCNKCFGILEKVGFIEDDSR